MRRRRQGAPRAIGCLREERPVAGVPAGTVRTLTTAAEPRAERDATRDLDLPADDEPGAAHGATVRNASIAVTAATADTDERKGLLDHGATSSSRVSLSPSWRASA